MLSAPKFLLLLCLLYGALPYIISFLPDWALTEVFFKWTFIVPLPIATEPMIIHSREYFFPTPHPLLQYPLHHRALFMVLFFPSIWFMKLSHLAALDERKPANVRAALEQNPNLWDRWRYNVGLRKIAYGCLYFRRRCCDGIYQFCSHIFHVVYRVYSAIYRSIVWGWRLCDRYAHMAASRIIPTSPASNRIKELSRAVPFVFDRVKLLWQRPAPPPKARMTKTMFEERLRAEYDRLSLKNSAARIGPQSRLNVPTVGEGMAGQSPPSLSPLERAAKAMGMPTPPALPEATMQRIRAEYERLSGKHDQDEKEESILTYAARQMGTAPVQLPETPWPEPRISEEDEPPFLTKLLARASEFGKTAWNRVTLCLRQMLDRFARYTDHLLAEVRIFAHEWINPVNALRILMWLLFSLFFVAFLYCAVQLIEYVAMAGFLVTAAFYTCIRPLLSLFYYYRVRIATIPAAAYIYHCIQVSFHLEHKHLVWHWCAWIERNLVFWDRTWRRLADFRPIEVWKPIPGSFPVDGPPCEDPLYVVMEKVTWANTTQETFWESWSESNYDMQTLNRLKFLTRRERVARWNDHYLSEPS